MPIYQKDYKDEDEEIVVVNNQKEQGQPPAAHENEDLQWKDRYGNLRSYSQKQLNAKDKEIADLKRQLTKPALDFPKTKEEVQEWAKKYPEPYAFVKSIIGMDLTPVLEDVSTRFDDISAREAAANKREADLKLRELHPDFFDTIKDSQEFIDWLSTKSKKAQAALYEEDDPVAAAEVITLYKVETNYGKNKKPKNERGAAHEVTTRGTPPQVSRGTGEYDFTESQINAMGFSEYDEKEAEIEAARKAGRILYDLSGGAR